MNMESDQRQVAITGGCFTQADRLSHDLIAYSTQIQRPVPRLYWTDAVSFHLSDSPFCKKIPFSPVILFL